MRDRVAFVFVLSLAGLLVAAPGCKSEVECKTEVTAGDGTYAGSARGKEENRDLRTASIKDACRQMCAAKKEVLVDGCAKRCAADVEAGKVGGKTTCN